MIGALIGGVPRGTTASPRIGWLLEREDRTRCRGWSAQEHEAEESFATLMGCP
jgi:hypothetical protein